MTKKLRVTSDVFHAWAHQLCESAECSSVSFRGPVLFSYAEPIALLLPDNGVMHSTGTWSVTTSSHQSMARAASRNRTPISAPCVPSSAIRPFDHENNKIAWTSKLSHCAKDLAEHPRRTKSIGGKAGDLYAQMKAYSDYFKLDWDFNQDALTLGREAVVKAEVERRKAAELCVAQQALRLQAWRDGADDSSWFEVTALRIKGDNIETSRGARVPVSVAKSLWAIANKCRRCVSQYAPHQRGLARRQLPPRPCRR